MERSDSSDSENENETDTCIGGCVCPDLTHCSRCGLLIDEHEPYEGLIHHITGQCSK